MGDGSADGVQQQLGELAMLLRRARDLFGDRPVTPPVDITPSLDWDGVHSAFGG